MTNTRSTGRHRESRGQNVLRSIVITVVLCAATFASPAARTDVQLLADETTHAAGLAAGKPAIDLYEVASVPSALVFQHARQLRPTDIRDAASKFPIANHPTDVEILDDDRLVFTNESSAQLVEMIPSPISNAGMQTSQLQLGFVSVLRSFLFAGESARQGALALKFAVVVTRVGDLLSGRKRREMRETYVDPDGSVETGQWLYSRIIAQERDIPTTSSVKRHGDRTGIGALGERSRPADGQWIDHLRQEELSVTKTEGSSCEFCRATMTALLELRIPSAPGEEVSVRDIKMPERLLQRDRRDFAEPCEFRLPLERCEIRARGFVTNRLLLGPPRFRPQIQCVVVDEPTASNRPTQQDLLLGRWIESVAKAAKHRETVTDLSALYRGFRPRSKAG